MFVQHAHTLAEALGTLPLWQWWWMGGLGGEIRRLIHVELQEKGAPGATVDLSQPTRDRTDVLPICISSSRGHTLHFTKDRILYYACIRCML